ncbi:hypothetical protein KIW84_UN0198 [Lathyrus oleraceus]|nr:hypothetical protein KIW84_UN0198 [Pisum sativum]
MKVTLQTGVERCNWQYTGPASCNSQDNNITSQQTNMSFTQSTKYLAISLLQLSFDQSQNQPTAMPPGLSISAENIELSYRTLSSLEDVIAMLRNDTSIDPSEVSTGSFLPSAFC